MMPLTFVNTDQGTWRYDVKTRSRIRAHVMREFAKQRRIEDTIAFQQVSNRLQPLVPIQPKLLITGRLNESSKALLDCSPLRNPSPMSTVGPVRADPFESLPIKAVPYMHAMLDHYVRRVSPRMIPNHITGEESPLNKWWVPLAMTDPAFFHSLLLSATHSYSIMSSEETMGLRPFYHRGESLRLISEAMHDKARAIEDAMIAAVLNTAAYEVTTGNHTAYHAHMSGLVSLVAMRGGLDALGLNGFLKQMVYWTDTLGSSITGQSSRFLKPTNSPTLTPMVALQHTHNQPRSDHNPFLGNAFQALLSNLQIGPHTARILESACCLTVALESGTQHQPSKAGFMGYEQQRNLIDLHLLNLRKPPGSTPIQDVCAAASLIYTRSVLNGRASLPLNSFGTLDRLKSMLTDIGSFAYVSKPKETILQCLLWATVLGAMMATGSQRRWYIGALNEASDGLSLQSWDDVKELLVRFLWLDTICDKAALSVWEEACELEWHVTPTNNWHQAS